MVSLCASSVCVFHRSHVVCTVQSCGALLLPSRAPVPLWHAQRGRARGAQGGTTSQHTERGNTADDTENATLKRGHGPPLRAFFSDTKAVAMACDASACSTWIIWLAAAHRVLIFPQHLWHPADSSFPPCAQCETVAVRLCSLRVCALPRVACSLCCRSPRRPAPNGGRNSEHRATGGQQTEQHDCTPHPTLAATALEHTASDAQRSAAQPCMQAGRHR